MASGKQYEMLFKLSASLGGEFTSTFNKASATMTATQQKARELMNQQSNISAYQKQQTAVDSTARKLEDLQKQYDNIQKEYQETGESSSALANKMIDKQRQIDKTSESLANQTAKLDKMEAELKEAGVDTDHLGDESKKLEAELKDTADQMDDYADKSVSGFEAIGSALVAAGIVEGLKKIADAYKECLSISSEFEAKMSEVEALSGAEGDALAALGAKAKQMGADTAFTATQSAEAFSYMALAGWKTEQMIEGIEPILNLAAAAQMDLGQASDIVTDYLTAFGKTAKEAGQFADIMAYAMANSNTNVQQLGEAYKSVAATATSMGYSIEETTAIIMNMANAGVKGGEAGTALNAIMTRLATDTKGCASALEEYGVHVYDSQGNMNSLSSILTGMSKVWGELTQEQQANMAKTIAGVSHYSQLQIIMNACSESAAEGGQSFSDYAAALQNCSGSAGKMAATMLDNLNGQMTLLDSATDAVKTTIGEAFAPELTKLTEIATKVMSGVNDFLVKHPALTKAIIAITAEVGAFVGVYMAYIAAKKIYKKVTEMEAVATWLAKVAQDGLNASMLANPAVLVLAGVVALTAGIIALSAAMGDGIEESEHLTAASKEEYDALQAKKAEYEEACELYGENSDKARGLAAEVEILDGVYESNKQTISQYVEELKEFNDAAEESLSSNREAFENAQNQTTGNLALAASLETLAQKTNRSVAENAQMKAIIEHLSQEVPNLKLNYDDLAKGTGNTAEAIEAMLEAQGRMAVYEAAQEGYAEAYVTKAQAMEQLKEATLQQEQAQQNLSDAEQAYMDRWGDTEEASAKIMQWFSSERKNMSEAQDEYDNCAAEVERLRGEISQADTDMQDYTNSLTGATTATEGMTEDELALNAALEETNQKVTTMIEAYNEAYDAAYKSISGQYDLWDEAAEVSSVSVSTMTSNLEAQEKYWSQYNNNLSDLQKRSAEIDGLSDVIASFADGSEDSVNAIAGMAKASDAELKKMVAQYQATQKQQEAAAGSLADVTTEFTNTMDTLGQQMNDTVGKLELSSEAQKNAVKTIEGYINGVESKKSSAVSAFGKLGDQAAAALKKAVESTTITAKVQVSTTSMPEYATGTENALAGLALVGEKGPELVDFKGGERVIPADRTAAMLGSSYTVSVSPVINISGTADRSTAEDIAAMIAQQVEETLNDLQRDNSRRVYR